MRKQLLVCDLDNTLYDWVAYFVPAFYAMADAVVSMTGCDRERLLDDFREVHRAAHDSEHPFALLDTETIRKQFKGASRSEMARALDPAFHAFNSARKKNLKLYPGVRETLDALEREGVQLVAHTESKLYGVVDRLRRLDLSKYFIKVYCRERSLTSHPANGIGTDWLADFPMDRVVELSHHQTKPNRDVLLEICTNEGFTPQDAAYVGDSIPRDVLMAKRAGVFAVWAAYGAMRDPQLYDALVRISHWTPEEIARERRLREEAREIEPDYVLRDSFTEIANASPFAIR